MNKRLRNTLLLFLLFTNICRSSNNDSLKTYKYRKIGVGLVVGKITVGSLVYLNQVWYKSYKTSSFHLFDDNNEWYQLDKCGHFLTTYQTSQLMIKTLNWCGVKQKRNLYLGALSGFGYLTAVEIMDGFSSGWGFSLGDMAANTLGSAIGISQYHFWKEQRISFKLSYHTSGLANYRPELLGKTVGEQLLKDYNGHTFWMSVNPSSFLSQETKFPKWLNLAIGYGADGMLGARYNNVVIQDEQGRVKNFDRYRQYYLSLDIDCTRIKTSSKFLKTVFEAINIIKIPAPTLELSNKNFKFHYIYF